MYNKEMFELGSRRSVIRELFEYGKKMASEVGEDKVFDFSLGNPNVPAPKEVKDAILELANMEDSTKVHGYTSAQGDLKVRQEISKYINERFKTKLDENCIYMTVGAAAGLCVCLNALNEGHDEFVTFAPFFPEYNVFVKSAGGVLKVVPFVEENFEIDLEAFENTLNEKTKAIILNSPNNPSGVVYSENTIKKIADILNAKSKEFGHPIFIICDEPYRELVFSDVKVPYLMNYYDNTLVCYSYSKSLSLPGERIGYIAVNPNMVDFGGMYAAICGAGRALGYVCAPSMFQKVIERCVRATTNLEAYKKNRDLIYNNLSDIGYKCVRPDGAFYLFVKALEEDANAFCEKAKKLGLLLVPGDSFGARGYVRIAYCVSFEMIERSLPYFEKLYNLYNKK